MSKRTAFNSEKINFCLHACVACTVNLESNLLAYYCGRFRLQKARTFTCA